MMPIDTNAIVTVGGGRGFVTEGARDRYVITAAHCLSNLPPPHGMSYLHERTYSKLLGPIGGECTVWAECLFADPVADIAVLGAPDNQELSEQADAYEGLAEAVTPLRIADPPPPTISPAEEQSYHSFLSAEERSSGVFRERMRGTSPARVVSLDRRLLSCTIDYTAISSGLLIKEEATERIVGGMSGSPILADDGSAIGIVCLSSGGPHPRLTSCLPGWLLRELGLWRVKPGGSSSPSSSTSMSPSIAELHCPMTSDPQYGIT